MVNINCYRLTDLLYYKFIKITKRSGASSYSAELGSGRVGKVLS